MADLYFENTKVFIEPMNVAAPFCEHILNEELSLYMKGYILGADCSIHDCLDEERIRWVVEEARRI